MTKRNIFVAGLASMAMAACAAFSVAYILRDPINESACAKIHSGMAVADVEQILGRPCDEEGPSKQNHGMKMGDHAYNARIRLLSEKTWKGSEGTINVEFEGDGTVKGVVFVEGADSLVRKIGRWFRIDLPTPEMSIPLPSNSL